MQARRIIAVSTWTVGTVEAQWPSAKGKSIVVPEALEPHWLAEDPPPDAERESTVLFVGSTRPNKNLHNLVEAFATLAARSDVNPNLRLRLIMVRDHHWPPVARRIRERGLSERVDVVSPQGDEGLRSEYRRAGVLAFVGTHEGFGLPPLEAMASGCPVVAARHAALPETCGEAAEFVDPGSPQSIAEGLHRILTDSGRRSALMEQGRVWARHRRWSDAAAMTLDEYDRAVRVA
jgi:glycosyltransferase involved in cell wall biosynthesis